MDLIGRVAVVAVLLIIVFTIAFLVLPHSGQSKPTPLQVVLKDVQDSNPGASVTVLSITNSTYENGSTAIVLSIVYNGTRPCPTVGIEQFDYPAFSLSSSYPNFYTQGHCIIINLKTNQSTYVISNPEIAVARSYNQSIDHNITNVTNYVSKFGYNNTVVKATSYPYLNNNQTHLSQSYYNVWLVKYSAANAPFSVFVVMYQNGSIITNYVNSSQ